MDDEIQGCPALLALGERRLARSGESFSGGDPLQQLSRTSRSSVRHDPARKTSILEGALLRCTGKAPAQDAGRCNPAEASGVSDRRGGDEKKLKEAEITRPHQARPDGVQIDPA